MGFVPIVSATTRLLANIQGPRVVLRARIGCTVDAHFDLLYIKVSAFLRLTQLTRRENHWSRCPYCHSSTVQCLVFF